MLIMNPFALANESKSYYPKKKEKKKKIRLGLCYFSTIIRSPPRPLSNSQHMDYYFQHMDYYLMADAKLVLVIHRAVIIHTSLNYIHID